MLDTIPMRVVDEQEPVKRSSKQTPEQRKAICERKVNELLQKYDCHLDVVQVFVNSAPQTTQIIITPNVN